MNRAGAWVAVLAAPLLAAGGPAAPAWQRNWTVTAIHGPPASARALAEIVGGKVVLAPDRVETPVTEPCATPDYADVRVRPTAGIRRHFGAFWTLPRPLEARIAYGWVRCGRTNLGAFAFADPRRAYLFYEDGLVIALR